MESQYVQELISHRFTLLEYLDYIQYYSTTTNDHAVHIAYVRSKLAEVELKLKELGYGSPLTFPLRYA